MALDSSSDAVLQVAHKYTFMFSSGKCLVYEYNT